MPIVHTFYEPVQGMANPQRLLELWRRSWEENGFTTRILNRNDARSHPGYDYFLERVSRFPSSNPDGYDLACFLRHLAVANVAEPGEHVIITDYDVINRTFDSDRLLACSKLQGCRRSVILEPTRVPCAVLGLLEGFEDICDVLCEYDPNGEPHVSDMTILRKRKIATLPMCVEHLNSGSSVPDEPGDGWKSAPMIHFSNYSFSKLGWTGDKADLIQRVLATL